MARCAQFASVLTPGRERVVSVDVDAEPLLLTSFGYDRLGPGSGRMGSAGAAGCPRRPLSSTAGTSSSL